MAWKGCGLRVGQSEGVDAAAEAVVGLFASVANASTINKKMVIK